MSNNNNQANAHPIYKGSNNSFQLPQSGQILSKTSRQNKLLQPYYNASSQMATNIFNTNQQQSSKKSLIAPLNYGFPQNPQMNDRNDSSIFSDRQSSQTQQREIPKSLVGGRSNISSLTHHHSSSKVSTASSDPNSRISYESGKPKLIERVENNTASKKKQQNDGLCQTVLNPQVYTKPSLLKQIEHSSDSDEYEIDFNGIGHLLSDSPINTKQVIELGSSSLSVAEHFSYENRNELIEIIDNQQPLNSFNNMSKKQSEPDMINLLSSESDQSQQNLPPVKKTYGGVKQFMTATPYGYNNNSQTQQQQFGLSSNNNNARNLHKELAKESDKFYDYDNYTSNNAQQKQGNFSIHQQQSSGYMRPIIPQNQQKFNNLQNTQQISQQQYRHNNNTYQHQNSAVQDLFKQRAPQPSYTSFLNKYKDPAATEDILNKYRKDDASPAKATKPKLNEETNSFYKNIIDVDSLKFKTPPPAQSIQGSNFAKPRPTNVPQIENVSSIKKAQVTINPTKSKQPEQMKKDIFNKLNMSSSGVPKVNKAQPASYHANEFVQKKNDEHTLKKLQKIIQEKTAHINLEKEQKQAEIQKQRDADRKAQQEELRKKQVKEKQDMLNSILGFNTTTAPVKVSPQKKTGDMTEEEFMKKLNNNIEAKAAERALLREQQQQLEGDQQIEECKEDVPVVKKMTREEKEREELLKRVRHHNRKTVDELVRPILNLDLVEMFSQQEKPVFNPVPLQFESFDHYRDIWIPLFLFETFNQMINQRSDNTGKELLEAQGAKFNPIQARKKHFEGYISRSGNDMHYIMLKLYENVKAETDKNGNYQNLSILDSLKEFDLLLITDEPLPTNEIKKITNADYLINMKKQKGKMLCIVSHRRKRDAAFITLKIDQELHQDYAIVNIRQNDHLKVHVYFFDSLITTIREFRTIKSCEFFPTANIILNPLLINEDREEHLRYLDPKRLQLMSNFIEGHKQNFNESQLQALDHVSKMKQEDFLLIQGPPGTGKTHTIQGIVTMLVSAGVKRILICAPSNAAIDEIVLRIAKYRLFGTLTEEQLKDKLLRIGSLDYDPLPLVKKYTLDTKIKDILDEQDVSNNGVSSTTTAATAEQKLQTLKERLQQIYTIRRIVSNDLCEKEKNRLNEMLKTFFQKTEDLQKFYKLHKDDRLKELAEHEKAHEKKREQIKAEQPQNAEQKRYKPKSKRNEIEKKIIEKAQIICTTLSMSANDKLEQLSMGESFIEYLIVDEACQCVELTDLIPFEHDPKKVILVGDQQQLPATTFSENSDRTFYSRSLFERFLQNGVNRFMLSIQYRMHPMIRQFPSDQFYEGQLTDASHLQNRQNDSSLPFAIRELQNTIQNLVLFDLKYAQEETKETSKSNIDEAQFIVELFMGIIKILSQSKNLPNGLASAGFTERQDFIGKELKSRIGIITPYKSQVRTLKEFLYPKLKQMNMPLEVLEINTVDAYQGREKDIIIISCVRGSQGRTLGFLNDYRRMNVAITRAKHFLWVVGNSRTLSRNENWDQFIKYSKSQGKEPRTKCPSYVQLNSKDSWHDHRLMNILTATSPSKNDDKEPSNQKDFHKNQYRDELPQKRSTPNNEQFQQNPQFSDKKRHHKYQEKFNNPRHTPISPEEGEIQSPEIKMPVIAAVQPPKSAVSDMFANLIANYQKESAPVVKKPENVKGFDISSITQPNNKSIRKQ